MRQIEVFADVACPFTHVGLRLFRSHRRDRGEAEPLLRVRAWPLSLDGHHLAPKVELLRRTVAPDLFAGFSADRFPASTREALASEAAAYGVSADLGERFSFEVREALFERGLDISDPAVLAEIRAAVGAPDPTDDCDAAVDADRAEGERRGVQGSPHFFTDDADFFCPGLEIAGDDVSFDQEGFRAFVLSAFGPA